MKKKYSVLLVDDDNINNYINVRLFQKLDVCCDVSIAPNGADALSHIENTDSFPDLIFLDIEMPVMNGLIFLHEYYKLNIQDKKDTQIIILAATVHPDYIDLINKYPIHSFISKPLTTEKLKEIMKEISPYYNNINCNCLSFSDPNQNIYSKNP